MQEKLKVDVRWPRALEFIAERGLNERFGGDGDVGLILQGGLYNTVISALRAIGLADMEGNSEVPLLVLNCVYPLLPSEIAEFCRDKKAVLVVEEGQPAFLETNIKAILSDEGLAARVHGKDCLPMAGEYVAGVLLEGMDKFLSRARSVRISPLPMKQRVKELAESRKKALEIMGEPVPTRPPGFCIGCPERPVFSALKLVQRDVGAVHVSADIGCHSFATLAPFNLGNTILGYGLGLASSVGLSSMMKNPVVSIMGDGGFWHQGLTTGVANHVFNKDEGVLIILKNG